MKTRGKLVLGIFVSLVVVTLFVFFFPWQNNRFIMSFVMDLMIRQSQRRRIVLLCETDHQALLKAGREILSQLPEDYLNTGGKRVAGILPIPKGVPIPKTIQNLRPHGVFVDYDGYLIIEMHGGMDHFGVRIYPEGYKEPEWHSKYVDRELLSGLWYYDEGYDHNPAYDRWIDTLIEENKHK